MITAEKNNMIIDVNNFYKKFSNGLSVFENISFDVKKGDIVSVVGPSGSGKSTLIRCIIGLDNSFSGSVSICGLINEEYLQQKRIAFVLQKYSNFNWLNVKKNIATAFKNGDLSPAEKEIKINSILDEVSLAGFEDYYMNQLSGGMQQRVAVARALVQDSDIIAMDEPFAALDMKIRESLQLLIKEINQHHQKTVLFVTHDIEEAIFLSDKIIVLTNPPVTRLKLYTNLLCFKSNYDPAVKYRDDFVSLRREIEDYIKGV